MPGEPAPAFRVHSAHGDVGVFGRVRGALGRQGIRTRMTRYICQDGGYEAPDTTEDDLDRVLCSQCGEPASEVSRR